MKSLFRLSFVAFSLFLMSCTVGKETFKDPDLGVTKGAIVEGLDGVYFLAVDGKYITKNIFDNGINGGTKKIEIKPGRHTIKVEYFYSMSSLGYGSTTSTDPVDLTTNFERNVNYRVYTLREKGFVTFKLE